MSATVMGEGTGTIPGPSPRWASSAGGHGMGALTSDFVEPDEARALVNDYYTLIRSAVRQPLGDSVRHGQIMQSLALFAREVMPEFQEREEQHQERKRALLSQHIA